MGDPLQTSKHSVSHLHVNATQGNGEPSVGVSSSTQILITVASLIFFVMCYVARRAITRRLHARNTGPAWGEEQHGYMDVDSLDFGAFQGGGRGAGPAKSKGYPERWLMLFLYALNMATLSALASVLPSSQLPAEKLYGVKAYPIVTLMSVLVFLSFPATILSSLLFDRFGIKGTCSIGLGISVLGAWLMVAAAALRHWSLQVVATVLCGIGGPLLANACTGLSAAWFGIDERNLPTAVGSVIPGALAGMVFNFIAVTNERKLPEEFFLVAVVVTVAAGMYMFLYIDSPPTPPSSEDRSSKQVALSSSVWQMLKDPNFLILLFLFTLDGYGWGIILVTSILSNIGYGQHEADVVMAIARWGSLSPLIVSPIADVLRKRDPRWPIWIMQVSQIGSFLAQLGLTLVLQPGMFAYIAFFFFWVGFFTTSAAPILLELVAETTYPAPETVSAGVCLTVFGVSTFGFVQLSQAMATTNGIDGYLHFFWLQNVLFGVSCVLVIGVLRADLKRTDRANERLHEDVKPPALN